MNRLIRPLINIAIPLALLTVVSLGCIGGSGKTCTGELSINGETYKGIDDNEAEAKRNSCAKFCIEGDTEMDVMFRIWLDSLSEKERKRVRKGDQGKWDAIYKSDRIKSYVEKCEKRCLEAKGGGIKVTCTG